VSCIFSHIKYILNILIAIFSILLIGCVDFKYAPLPLHLFYVIPVMFIAWKGRPLCGYLIAIFAALLWVAVHTLSGHIASNQYVFYWSLVVNLLFFIGIIFLVQNLKITLKKEQENSKLNSDMVSAVSHEFNNLLTGLNLTALLLEEGESEGSKKIDKERLNLYKMHRYNYTAMSEQIKVFLNKSKLESGTVRLDIKKSELRNIIDGTVNHFLPMAYQKNIKIIRDFPKIHHLVKCDIDLISLAISNLLSNAIKYSPKDKNIRVRLRRISGNFLKIGVKDYGIGIDKEDFEKIFDGFYRTQKSIQHATGFGIGLKMTKNIVELHNSKLEMKSRSGEGSEFTFKLPLYMDDTSCKLKNKQKAKVPLH
jgi:two-component system, chemotaxis family, CheB/CheR fusion protein